MPTRFERFFASVRHHGGIKLLAILLALITWYAIREATSFEAVIKDVGVEVLVDEGWAVLDRSVTDVDILFRGSQGDIRYLNRDQIRISVDMRGRSRAGTAVVRLTPSNVRAPGGARPILVDPGEITLSLDRENDRQVPVKADVLGHPPEGFEVERVVSVPAMVTLHGPQRRIADVDLVRSAPIELEGRMRSFQLSRPILAPSDNWSARIEPDRVRVEVFIVERSAEKTLGDVRVNALLPPQRSAAVRIEPQTVTLKFKGRSDLVEGLQRESLTVFVDCSALNVGDTRDLPVRATLPGGLSLVEVVPPLVRVDMESQRP